MALRELDALRQIVGILQRGSVPVAVSERSLEEFLRLLNPSKRSRLVTWAYELLDWWRGNRDALLKREVDERREAEDLVQSGRLDFLPDYSDRLLVAEALVLGCDTFLTLDRKTIIRFREQIQTLGLEALTPAEFVDRYL